MEQIFQKRKVVTGKTPLFVIGPFLVAILFVLTLASNRADLIKNDVFSILVVSTEKWQLEFFGKGFRFLGTLFQSIESISIVLKY